MAATSTVGSAARATRGWAQRRANRRALARFGEFWRALQQVGDVLAEAERMAKAADDSSWRNRNQRHWSIATADEVRKSVKGCRSSLRIVSSQAKRFEPQLIVKDWRR
ncbi:hypothetical protein [Pseudonocardia nigra]|uniref:hypothetical protein n=1 Tax=Pseudonocardia nigra TaxID=1921578 RepID=UPI001C5F9219|nr:hypothetical protein [Pseudonocardia nigra]